MSPRTAFAVGTLSCLWVFVGCTDGSDSQGSDGPDAVDDDSTTGDAGPLGLGGFAAKGSGGAGAGAPSTGGARASGGTDVAGGAVATGGLDATGDAFTIGGMPATGGVSATGGAPATGGSRPTGGAPASGGSPASGGAQPTGGSEQAGGTPAAGGVEPAGGAPAAGGEELPSGGTLATGGAVGSGGTREDGGALAAAGAEPSGGAPAASGGGCGDVADPARQGPLRAQSYSSGLRDGPDYGSQTMHYPTDGAPPYPALAIVPGFMSLESSIADWGPYLASHGIVTLTIGTNSMADQPPARSEALLDALETIRAENTRAGGHLEGKLDLARLGVMGWSMGGGGTLITVEEHPELKAAITLCAWNPGQTYRQNQVPTLLFAGTADVLAGGQSQGFYTSIPETTPKMLFEVQGADHFFANTPAGASGQCGKYGTAWLKVFLVGDDCYRPFLLEPPSGTSDFRTNVE